MSHSNFLDRPLSSSPLRLVDTVEQQAQQEQPTNFITSYMEYTKDTEPTTFFHRWTAITCLSAYIGSNIYFQHGHFIIRPNLYAMLIGSPGTKKSSAIKMGAKLLVKAGYTTFAAKKTRQEKFLLDMAEQADRYLEGDDDGDVLDNNLFGDSVLVDESRDGNIIKYKSCPPCEIFVAADEFNNFIGLGNTDFISILGELWDYEGLYDYRLKNSKSVYIPNPIVTILGGNTPTGFAQAFPTESMGQGFFSRLLLVYGESSGIKHTFPPTPNPVIQRYLIAQLHKIKNEVKGEVTLTDNAMQLVDHIYRTWKDIDDLRFEHYSNRRLNHLIKLILVVTASRCSTTINVDDVVYANTVLTFTESLMPKALGEFGKARNSDVTHKITVALDNTLKPLSVQELWKVVAQDLDNRNQLMEIINNLMVAEKIQTTPIGYLPIKKVLDTNDDTDVTLNWNLLTEIERGLL